MVIHGENLSTVQQMLDHASLQPTAIYARLNVDALAGALQANADRFSAINKAPDITE
jgi:site-specific recombinase XerD